MPPSEDDKNHSCFDWPRGLEPVIDVESRFPHVEAGTRTAQPFRLLLWEEDVGGLGP